uniref:Glycosyltransferase n=1 Tax=Mesocestoides corti TaxID=53468 RepID=A0A5K3FQR0_MESCO
MPILGNLSCALVPTCDEKIHFTPIVRAYLTEQLGEEPKHVEILAISSEVVDGTNYFLKVTRI